MGGGASPRLPLSSAGGRWLIAATALGSGIAFLDGTVVNVALPSIRRELGGGLTAQQWVVDGYLLTLSALLLLGGALGDRYGRRRIFVIGLVAFAVTSFGCGVAPSPAALVIARAAQGIAGALLVPGSLALIDEAIDPRDRGRAVGAWAGLSGVSTAIGPFIGGWLVDAVSWRLVFFINLPLAAIAVAIAVWRLPERIAVRASSLDLAGAFLVTAGLAGVIYALIEAPTSGRGGDVTAAAVVGVGCLAAFFVVEARRAAPMLPLTIFRSRQFSGANLTTLAVYAALGGALFLLSLQLQESLRYSAFAAGLAMLPVTVIMVALSPRMGALSDRPRTPMTIGPLVAGVGLALMARVTPGRGYVDSVLPAVVVFGIGLSLTVAPLTSTVLAAVEQEQVGIASGVNNAVARIAGLLAVAVLPVAAGVKGGGALGPGFGRAMLLSAALCWAGGLVSFVTIRAGSREPEGAASKVEP
ncbi:MAG TPA: DHA2 family efflux MFS transporter permease subunit [Acidothermaceae bacterium]